jgi:arsenate reductase (thioredoxin)
MAKRILFACIHNAGRSQMAAALFNKVADPEKAGAPKGRPVDEVRGIRDEIEVRVAALVESRGWGK